METDVLILGAGPFGRHGYREFFPSLGPAPSEHIAAAGGFHAGEKTMGAFSLYVARLIGSFHRNNTPSGRRYGQVVISIIPAP